jgi:LPS export ABC transporter protein LptC
MQTLPKIITAAFFTGCFFLLSCENDEDIVNSINRRRISTEEARHIKLNYTTGGRIKAILTAPLMLRVQDTAAYYEFPNSLYTEFYNDEQQKESNLTAHYGKYKDGENLVYLRDSVRIINILKGDTIYCDDLYWDRNRPGVEFYTNKPVHIRQKDGQHLDGDGMEAAQSFKDYHIINPRGVLNTKADQLP